MASLASKVALVTGAASGLGRATAERFLKAGARVAFVDLPNSPGAEVVKAMGDKAIFCPADVTDEEQVAAALEAAHAKFGPVNAAVNCAGIAYAKKVLNKDGPHALDIFARTLTVNTVGTFNVCRLAAQHMSQQEAGEDGERGVLVNTASIAAFDGQIGQAAYSASKGAVVGMMLPLAREFSKYGIRVNTVAPGVFLTPLLESLPQKAQDALAAAVPFPKRLGRPDEFGALVQHIVENQMINGEVIRCDGALRMT